MSINLWPPDTIARRIALTILSAVIVTVALGGLFVEFAGVWARPSAEAMGLQDRADDIVRIVEAVPEPDRQALLRAVSFPGATVDWYPATSLVAAKLAAADNPKRDSDLARWFQSDGRQRPLRLFQSDSELSTILPYDRDAHPHAYFLAVQLKDSSWVVFTAARRVWGLRTPIQIGIAVGFLVVSILAASAVATYHLSRPIRRFTEELRRFGADPRAAPIPEAGPRELRATITAFNGMQAKIRKFVDDRTAMLAAISHDLRTPLTKIRLRGEFIEDEDQRARLFRDVDDLQAMADSALAFFKADYKEEEITAFDFPGLLRTIVDDYGDRGTPVAYDGPDHAVFHGRPFALKRAITNLIDNAVKYGKVPEVKLHCLAQQVVLVVSDRGPGIPADALGQVFAPFYRLERSRNRKTGGVGLGLTSARAVVRGHGGDITLCNRAGGGVQVEVTLPVP
jgi:signal transduction histidine kinase